MTLLSAASWTPTSRTGAVLVAATCALFAGRPAYAQDSLQQVQTLYASAAYEDALSVLSRLQAVNRRSEYEQYRVFCLVALGRTEEAERAIASVVTADPSFQPEAGETSPRIREMFRRVRRTLVPEIAQRLYLQGKEALQAKETDVAVSKFESLLTLIDGASKDDPRLAEEEPMLPELRLLAAGFLDLTRAIPAAPPIPLVEPLPEPPASPVPVARPSEPLEISSPVPVKQDLPAWVPPDSSSRREFKGAIRVFISESGRVTGAELSPRIHPVYDRQLLMAAKSWEYQPALKNGAPIASEKVIEVVLKPR
jgi:tetratricopeptide (TPR) repeat protein